MIYIPYSIGKNTNQAIANIAKLADNGNNIAGLFWIEKVTNSEGYRLEKGMNIETVNPIFAKELCLVWKWSIVIDIRKSLVICGIRGNFA